MDKLLESLKEQSMVYFRSLGNLIKSEMTDNKICISTSLPTSEDFQEYIYNYLKHKGYDVSYRDYIIYIVLDGYEMPIIANLTVEDNIHEKGSIECSVWINDYVKMKKD